MYFYYGEKNMHRALDEATFWKHQEAEHTVVIREVTKGLEPEFVEELKKFEEAFNKTHGMVIKYIETIIRSKGQISPVMAQQIMTLIRFCIQQSQQFVILLSRILSESKAVTQLSQVVINHIRRESEYFIGIAQIMLM